MGILGAGNVLPAYLQVLDRLTPRGDAAVGPVCARRRETWDELRARRPGLELVEDARGVVESDADVVVIITPPESHTALARLALEHGKHVLVEKPLAATRSEAEPLVELAVARGLLLVAAPFVQLSPTFRAYWAQICGGAIGRVHSARALYGNAGSTWARWYHDGKVGPLAEVGIYNLKSLTALLGPVEEVQAAEATAVASRRIGDIEIAKPDPDVSHIILRHVSGALSSIASSHAIQRYRRPGLEVYGTEGTANLLGDDWDPRGFEIWRNAAERWEEYEAIEPTWNWADGLRELVLALRQGRPPRADLDHDLHLIDVIEAAGKAARDRRAVRVASRFGPLDLAPEESRAVVHHLHDHTRPADEQ
ncbi:MAG TPA: Gfo/Idh/MocA family oxidoreductase [Bryobacteraceae bacterium]|nr:Gfo/Idh/MocA family oxidoreductase [Bryobacteraceae bacterium]